MLLHKNKRWTNNARHLSGIIVFLAFCYSAQIRDHAGFFLEFEIILLRGYLLLPWGYAMALWMNLARSSFSCLMDSA
jgi:hypothetical protein